MRRVTCTSCGKVYDFDADDFCPKCGAFNQPGRQSQGTVRVDGVNESNHQGSFAHQEVHREKRVRRARGLDRDPLPRAKPAPPPMPAQQQRQTQRKKTSSAAAVIALVCWIIFMANLLAFCGAVG